MQKTCTENGTKGFIHLLSLLWWILVSPGLMDVFFISQGHVVQLTTFHAPTECFHCFRKLQGKFYQGYRCLRCQASLHKACLADCACLEVGTLTKSNSVCLPRAAIEEEDDMNDSGTGNNMGRSNSTLSLASPGMLSPTHTNGSDASKRVSRWCITLEKICRAHTPQYTTRVL